MYQRSKTNPIVIEIVASTNPSFISINVFLIDVVEKIKHITHNNSS
jgi:hypothetical protein